MPALLLLATPAGAQTCDRLGCGRASGCFTPAQPAPTSLWGDLQPTDTTLCSSVGKTGTDPQTTACLPPERDASDFNEFTQSYASRNWYYDVDVENGFLFAGLAHGIAVFDGRSNPASPSLLKVRRFGPCASTDPGCANLASPFVWMPGGENSKIVFESVAVPAGVDTIAAVAGHNGAGLLVFSINGSDHSLVTAKYQSVNKDSQSVYAATIGGVHYAFMASKPNQTTLGNAASSIGVIIYNLDRAVAQNGCLEDLPSAPLGTGFDCPANAGVYVGTIPATSGTPTIVHGVGNYLVVSLGALGGFQIFDVSVPTSPQLKLQALPGTTVQGVAMWQQGSSYYLAARLGTQTKIYDVSCITGTCSGLGNPLSSGTYDGGGSVGYLSFSRSSGGRPFLYLGSDGTCAGADGLQHEWLLDVSDPRNPIDVTPPQTIAVTAPYNGVSTTVNVNYWSWYYRGSPTGFYLVAPRHGAFNGDYFYRAGRSIMDFHRLTTASPPFSDFDWTPTTIYPGDTVTFNDRSSGVPSAWSWSFSPDGAPGFATVQNPQVSFAGVGTKTVTLTATNSVGTGSLAQKSVTVLDPTAQVTGVTPTPASAIQCQQVNLTANGVAGKPTLSYAWTDANGGAVSGLVANGTSATWNVPGNFPANTSQTIKFTVSNPVPSSASASTTIAVSALPTLATPPAPTTDPFTAGTVQFHLAAVAGATTWSWSFGSGATPATYTTSDSTLGPNPPAVTYSTTGQKTVTVTVSNCVNTAGLSSSTTITILQTTPLVASFQAVCSFAPCSFTSGSPITFVDSSTGATYWDYDWTHTTSSSATCSFTDSGHTSPVTSHTYTTTGNYQPCLRVRRGTSEQNVYVHPSFSVSSGAPPPTPSITISGPSSGQVNAALSFTASASNCTPGATWSWNVGSGTINGGATGASLSVTWSATGTQSLSVTNSGCGSATGFKSVSISNGSSGGGGSLAASFTVSPATPTAGSAAAFDGSGSTGSPTSYFWTFGDGSTSSSGATVSHTYSQPGSYLAKLDVSASMSPSACSSVGGFYSSGICIKTTSQSLTVMTAGPPPLAADFTSGICTIQFGLPVCAAQTGVDASFSSTANDQVTNWSWDFGDGGTASGQTATHHWDAPGSYTVALTVSDGSRTASKSVNVNVTGAPKYAYILPWIWKTAVTQAASRDFYAYNPGASAMTLTVRFLRAGGDINSLPAVQIPIAPGQTFRNNDPLGLFSPRIANGSGFLYFTWDGGGSVDPVIASTSGVSAAGADQPAYGGTVVATKIPQISTRSTASTTLPLLHLVGLAETPDRLTTVGFSNPYGTPAAINVRFYDSDGNAIGTPVLGLAVARNGQRQFTVGKIRDLMGVTGADVRATVEAVSGGPVTAFGEVSTTASQDPSFVAPGSTGHANQYLVGVATDSNTATDVLLVNPGTNVVLVDMTFKDVVTTVPQRDTVHLTLSPGESMRIADVLRTTWGMTQGLGTLVFESDAVDNVYPIVRGELHSTAAPASQVGMVISPLSDDDAAASTDVAPESLLSWRQEAGYEPTVWIFNPTSDFAQFDLVFLDGSGQPLGTKSGLILGPGRMRQFKAAGLPLPPSVAGGFTLQVRARAGKVFVTGQVRTLATGDTWYVGPSPK